ncbi:hypothetical protein ScPMuIL_016873 [Solemya velum]
MLLKITMGLVVTVARITVGLTVAKEWVVLLLVVVASLQVFGRRVSYSKLASSHIQEKRYCYNTPVAGVISTVCFDCPAGKWGSREKTCVDCLYGRCRGKCSTSCGEKDFQVPLPSWAWGRERFCDSDSADCYRCERGQYGPECELRCSDKCDELGCDSDSGNCFRCDRGYYGSRCLSRCSTGCDSKGGSCDQVTADCDLCKDGWIGDKCSCRKGCVTYGCKCTACAPGFYGDRCDRQCPVHCDPQTCDNRTGVCRACEPGYYGDKCEARCPTNCDHRGCDKTTGHCYGCLAMWSGDRCLCHGECYDNGDCSCTRCDTGYYGDDCNIQCPENCGPSGCDKTGICQGCTKNYNGSYCEGKCPNCKACEQYTGECTMCGWYNYGPQCEGVCSSECKDNLAFLVQCDVVTGHCLAGCSPGYTGDRCLDLIPKQLESSSTIDTELVVGGFFGGVAIALLFGAVCVYYGDRCKMKTWSGNET